MYFTFAEHLLFCITPTDMNKTEVIYGIWFSFIHQIKCDILQVLLPSFLIKVEPTILQFASACPMELPSFRRRDVTSDIAERMTSDDCRQNVLLWQTSIQPSLIFCHRRVTDIDKDHAFTYQEHYFFKQQTEMGGRRETVSNEFFMPCTLCLD